MDAGSWYTIASNEEYIFFEYLSEFNDMGMSKIAQLWMYNLQNGDLEKIFDYSQDSDESHLRLKDITSGETMELPENIYDYVSTGNDIAVRYSIGQNADNGLPVMELKLIGSETIIFSGEYNIDKLQANEYFTVWTNLVDEYPILYDNVHNQMLYLESMDKAEHSYWLKDNYGLILSMIHHQDETVEYIYTFFEYEMPLRSKS